MKIEVSIPAGFTEETFLKHLKNIIDCEVVTTNFSDVLAFHEKFGVPRATSPSFLNDDTLSFRSKFLQEELDEFMLAHLKGDMHNCLDSLIDLVYVAMGTADMMGLPWQPGWKRVQAANMAKVRATAEEQSKRGTTLDVVKPAGWEGPDHSQCLGNGPWPTY